jgi:hypothetical protein
MPIEVPSCFLFGGAERGCYRYLNARDILILSGLLRIRTVQERGSSPNIQWLSISAYL